MHTNFYLKLSLSLGFISLKGKVQKTTNDDDKTTCIYSETDDGVI